MERERLLCLMAKVFLRGFPSRVFAWLKVAIARQRFRQVCSRAVSRSWRAWLTPVFRVWALIAHRICGEEGADKRRMTSSTSYDVLQDRSFTALIDPVEMAKNLTTAVQNGHTVDGAFRAVSNLAKKAHLVKDWRNAVWDVLRKLLEDEGFVVSKPKGKGKGKGRGKGKSKTSAKPEPEYIVTDDDFSD